MAHGVQDFTARLRPSAFKLIDDFNDQLVTQKLEHKASGIFTEETSKDQYDEVRSKGLMGGMDLTPEQAPLNEQQIGDGFVKRIPKFKYTTKAGYSLELETFKNMGAIADITRGVASSKNITTEQIALFILECGQLATSAVPTTAGGIPIVDTEGADGNPLFSRNHPDKQNPLVFWHNRSNGYLDLSRASLQTVSNEVELTRLSNGQRAAYTTGTLIVPTTLKFTAAEILKSEKQPETGNNAINSIYESYGKGDYFVYRGLTSQTDWYVKTSARNELKFRYAITLKKDDWYDKNTQTYYISATTLFGHAAYDAKSLYKVTA